MVREAYRTLDYKWRDYQSALERIQKEIKVLSYSPFEVIEEEPTWLWEKHTSFRTDLYLLPHEFHLIELGGLLTPRDIPELPALPEHPPLTLERSAYPDWYFSQRGQGSSFYDNDIAVRNGILGKTSAIQQSIDATRDRFQKAHDVTMNVCAEVKRGIENGELKAIEKIIVISHQRHFLPKRLRNEFKVSVDAHSQLALIEFKFPDYSGQKGFIVGFTGPLRDKPKYCAAIQARKYIKQCLYSLIIRSAYLAANLCIDDRFKSVVVNVEQDWYDPATGAPRNGLIASLQGPVGYLRSLDLSKLDPEACFKHLKGINTPSLENISPIRPIFVLNKEDDRFVSGREIDGKLEPETNLATIPWEDFEHLVAQLFEWEFKNKGMEVRVTRVSRDRGVDAILFDPDPLRGGKYVLQAKRYTRTVDVSAVRDLYGTLMNEGANRGILITTSSYGADAYEFVKDKPISLVDGPNLILLLQKHGKNYRIDLEEARRLNIGEGG